MIGDQKVENQVDHGTVRTLTLSCKFKTAISLILILSSNFCIASACCFIAQSSLHDCFFFFWFFDLNHRSVFWWLLRVGPQELDFFDPKCKYLDFEM